MHVAILVLPGSYTLLLKSPVHMRSWRTYIHTHICRQIDRYRLVCTYVQCLHIWNIILFLLIMMACSQRMEVGGRSCVSHYKRFRITCPQIDNHPAALLVMHIPEPLETTVVYSVSNEGKLVPRTSFWSPKVCKNWEKGWEHLTWTMCTW